MWVARNPRPYRKEVPSVWLLVSETRKAAQRQNMTHWQHGHSFSRNTKLRWEKRLRQLKMMRDAKERKRLTNQVEAEPKMERCFRFEYAVRDKITQEMHWHDLVSVRQAATALGLIQKYL